MDRDRSRNSSNNGEVAAADKRVDISATHIREQVYASLTPKSGRRSLERESKSIEHLGRNNAGGTVASHSRNSYAYGGVRTQKS